MGVTLLLESLFPSLLPFGEAPFLASEDLLALVPTTFFGGPIIVFLCLDLKTGRSPPNSRGRQPGGSAAGPAAGGLRRRHSEAAVVVIVSMSQA